MVYVAGMHAEKQEQLQTPKSMRKPLLLGCKHISMAHTCMQVLHHYFSTATDRTRYTTHETSQQVTSHTRCWYIESEYHEGLSP